MSVVIINGVTYNDVDVMFQDNDDPKAITFTMPKGELDLDDVARDFSNGGNIILIDGVEYKGYVSFRSLGYDLNNIVVFITQKSIEEQLADANKEIEELQDATAEILEIIGG